MKRIKGMLSEEKTAKRLNIALSTLKGYRSSGKYHDTLEPRKIDKKVYYTWESIIDLMYKHEIFPPPRTYGRNLKL